MPRHFGGSAARARTGFLAALIVMAVAGCSGTAATSSTAAIAASVAATTAPTPAPSVAATASTAASAPAVLATSGPTAVVSAIDPCQLFTSQEASQLAGASFGAGKESTTSGNVRMCTYGAQSANVFNVDVAQAPDVATAQAAKAQALAEAGNVAKGLKLTELPNFADGAAVLEGSVAPINASGIYVLKGTVFFSLNDVALGSPAPSSAALQAAATTILGRLP